MLIPIYSPRSQYRHILQTDQSLLSDLTLNFDKFTLGLMKKQFNIRDNALTLKQFTILCKQYMSNWQQNKPLHDKKLTRCLLMLFNEIDIDGNGNMQWDQFTNYIITRALYLKNLKSDMQQTKYYTATQLKIKQKIDPISKAILVGSNLIAMFQDGKDRIILFDLITSKSIITKLTRSNSIILNGKKSSVSKETLKTSQTTNILDIQYIGGKKYQMMLTSTSDGYVRGWKVNHKSFYLANQPDNEEQTFQHKFSIQVYSMAWDTNNQALYCGHKNGSISVWNIKTDTINILATSCDKSKDVQIPIKNKNNSQLKDLGHDGIVMCMVTMPSLQFLASGGMDGKLILWDRINNKKKKVYTQHSKGILTLVFHQRLILILSGGFDHKICIWNPYIQTLIHKIQNHKCAIYCIRLVQQANQFVSLDIQGNVKIFNIKRFNMVSSFVVQSNDQRRTSPSFSYVLPISDPLRLLFCGRSIKLYEYDKNYDPKMTDDCDLVAIRYNKSQLSFFTASSNKIKIWNGLTGNISKLFLNTTKGSITSFQFDRIQKRMLLGDNQGGCYILNALNGVLIKNITSHKAQIIKFVSQIIHNLDVFITIGMDNFVIISSDNSLGQSQIIRTIHITKLSSITSFITLGQQCLLVIGTSLGPVGFYQCETGKLAGSTLQSQQSIVTSITAVKDYYLLFITYNSGKIVLLLTGNFYTHYTKILSFTNLQNKSKQKMAIIDSCFQYQKKYLYICDQHSDIKCLSFYQVFQQLKPLRYDMQQKTNLWYRPSISFEQIPLIWYRNVNTDKIIQIELIVDQCYLSTISNDRKARLFDIRTGQLIVIFQQNYNRDMTAPIGYIRDDHIFKTNLQDRIQNQQQDGLNEYNMHFDPFYNFKRIKQQQRKQSNPNWKLHINFEQHYSFRQQQIQKVLMFQKEQNQNFYFEQTKFNFQHINPCQESSKLLISHPYQLQEQYFRAGKRVLFQHKSQQKLQLPSLYTKPIIKGIKQKINISNIKAKYGFQPVQKLKKIFHKTKNKQEIKNLKKRQEDFLKKLVVPTRSTQQKSLKQRRNLAHIKQMFKDIIQTDQIKKI